jgi:hypothetical protein
MGGTVIRETFVMLSGDIESLWAYVSVQVLTHIA